MRIVLEHVAARHPAAPRGRPALDEVSLTIATGERLALVGPSGAGKTTLLAVASLQLQPAAGRILVDGIDPWTLSTRARQRLRRRLFVAPQTPPLPPRQRVVTAVLAGRLPGRGLASSIASWLYPRDAAIAHAALESLGLGDKLWLRVDRLSGGERQRVALARLLVSSAEAWLVDEPLSALDPALAMRTLDGLVNAATRRGTTLVASLHQIDLAAARFPRLVGLSRGRVVFDRAADGVGVDVQRALYADEDIGGVPPAASLAAPLAIDRDEQADAAFVHPPVACRR